MHPSHQGIREVIAEEIHPYMMTHFHRRRGLSRLLDLFMPDIKNKT
jgi:hypothetical protein